MLALMILLMVGATAVAVVPLLVTIMWRTEAPEPGRVTRLEVPAAGPERRAA